MKFYLVFCGFCLFIATGDIPYYMVYLLLRIIVTIGAFSIIVSHLKFSKILWILLFALIMTLFNPIFPIYLNDKTIWIIIDVVCAILFFIKADEASKLKIQIGETQEIIVLYGSIIILVTGILSNMARYFFDSEFLLDKLVGWLMLLISVLLTLAITWVTIVEIYTNKKNSKMYKWLKEIKAIDKWD